MKTNKETANEIVAGNTETNSLVTKSALVAPMDDETLVNQVAEKIDGIRILGPRQVRRFTFSLKIECYFNELFFFYFRCKWNMNWQLNQQYMYQ